MTEHELRAADFPVGTIAITTALEVMRYPQFCIALDALRRPPGTVTMYKPGANVAESRNVLIREALGEWIFFMDDDHTFPDDVLLRLLADDVDVVGTLCLKKAPPWDPPVFYRQPTTPDGKRGVLQPLGLHDLWGRGLVHEHDGYPLIVGAAGLLIRKRVFDRVRPPYFAVGQLGNPAMLNEDFYFCLKLLEAGVKVHLDTRIRMGHIGPIAYWPLEDAEGRPLVGLDLGGNKWATIRIDLAQRQVLPDPDSAKVGAVSTVVEPLEAEIVKRLVETREATQVGR